MKSIKQIKVKEHIACLCTTAHVSQQVSWLGQAWSRMVTAHGAGQASIRQGWVWSMRSTAHGAEQASIRLDLAWLLSWTAPGAMLESTRPGLVWLLISTVPIVRPESTRQGQVNQWSYILAANWIKTWFCSAIASCPSSSFLCQCILDSTKDVCLCFDFNKARLQSPMNCLPF